MTTRSFLACLSPQSSICCGHHKETTRCQRSNPPAAPFPFRLRRNMARPRTAASSEPAAAKRRSAFKGLCLACEKKTKIFDATPENRLCKKCNLGQSWPANEHEKLVTIVPQWKTFDLSVIPPVTCNRSCGPFAQWADRPVDWPYSSPSQKLSGVRDWSFLLPYATDFLKTRCNFPCTSPICYRSERLQLWLKHDGVFVLDFSDCHPSGTHKDLRSHAIVNVAVEQGRRHLAVWTAGNAGISLAKLVRTCNHRLPANKRIRVYALFDQGDTSVDKFVTETLKNYECVLIPVPSAGKEIYSPAEIRKLVMNKAKGLPGRACRERDYWDVTDGWEAVGMLMYRLVAVQVVRDLRPTHIVAPLGTGNLLLAILRAVRDCEDAKCIERGKTVVIGAVPCGENNIVRQIERRKEVSPPYAKKRISGLDPLMPKIATTYTPLLGCIDQELENGQRTGLVRYYEATAELQEKTASELSDAQYGRRILCEPSSMAAFAVLPEVRKDVLKKDAQQRVLVVNSGFGIMSEAEQNFVSRHRST